MQLQTLFVVLASTICSGLHVVQAFRYAPFSSPQLHRHIRRAADSRDQHRRGQQLLDSCRRCAFVSVVMQDMEEIDCDVVIVGGGPAGCSCALYTSRSNFKTVILDKSPAIGALARTELIANYPGTEMNGVHGQVLLDQMREQAVHYGTIYRKAQVYSIVTDEHTKTVFTPEVTVRAKAVVLATGAMGREPYFKGEDEYLGKGVSYCATCDAPFYDGSEVAVVGSNPEAVEEAEHLVKFAKVVHWVTQGKLPEDDENIPHLLSNDNVKHWEHTSMKSVEGDESGVTGIVLQTRDDNNVQTLPVEGVFIYISGSKPITDFLENTEVALNDDGGVVADEASSMMTNVPGVFAIGDIRNTPFKQAVVAASDGCVAAMAIDRYLKKRKKIRVDWIHK